MFVDAESLISNRCNESLSHNYRNNSKPLTADGVSHRLSMVVSSL